MGRRLAALCLAVGVLAASCGDDDSGPPTSTPSDTAGFPTVVRGAEIPAMPHRIVSLSATHTEILYEIGAGPNIVATDLFSDYPAAAMSTEKVDAFNLSVEAVAALDPDLVVLAFDPGDAVTGLTALGVPVVLFAAPGPASLDEVYAEWRDLGTASGHAEEADALVARVSGEIEDIVARVPQNVRASTFFVELDSTLFTAGSGTLLDSIFGMLGMENIADPGAGPFVQLSPEFVVEADPDFIFLADTVCCGESAETVSQRPGWSGMGAVAGGAIVELDDSVASRWGPRLVELVSTIAAEVHDLG